MRKGLLFAVAALLALALCSCGPMVVDGYWMTDEGLGERSNASDTDNAIQFNAEDMSCSLLDFDASLPDDDGDHTFSGFYYMEEEKVCVDLEGLPALTGEVKEGVLVLRGGGLEMFFTLVTL